MRVRVPSVFPLLLVVVFFLGVLAASSSTATVSARSQGDGRLTNQLIVRFSESSAGAASVSAEGSMAELSQAAGEDLTYVRPMSGGAHVVAMNEPQPAENVADISARLARLRQVEAAEPDRIKDIHRPDTYASVGAILNPDDTYFGEQWHYDYAPGTAEGLNLPQAWATSSGSTETVVAVIDTGILNHPDLAGKILPGFDFISDLHSANDGDLWDDDPSDPGDWVAANECDGYHAAYNSSWHGTHVAGTIAAASNNGLGVTGVNWQAKILPVRVLGKCGGMTSDIADAIRWSAGLAVPGAPENAYPADVINLSLGGFGPCEAFEQQAIDDAVAAGATVVIAAGNSNADAAEYSPANCSNSITVAATERAGDRAYYSNYGDIVEVSAPGGETVWQEEDGVLSTLNTGTTVPGVHSYAFYQGTSMAAPHVAGLASLALGLDPTLSPAGVLRALQAGARDFPAGSSCSTSTCGAGIVDATSTLSFVQLLASGNSSFVPLVTNAGMQPTKALENGDFEAQQAGWTEFSTNDYTLIMKGIFLPVLPHGGEWAAWLGWGYGEISYIEQQLFITAARPYLTYWHWIDSDDDRCGNDYAAIIIDGNTVADRYDACVSENTYGWEQHSADLSAWAGQQVTLQIRLESDGDGGSNPIPGHRSNLFLDDVAMSASAAESGPASQIGAKEPFTWPGERLALERTVR